MTDNKDALDTMLDAFVTSWPEPRMSDPALTLVLGNLRGFVGFMRERGYSLSPPQTVLVEALNCRDLFINPAILRRSADEIDCCNGSRCDHAWHEWDTNASGCRQSECGEYCPNDVAETLRALANVAEGKRP